MKKLTDEEGFKLAKKYRELAKDYLDDKISLIELVNFLKEFEFEAACMIMIDQLKFWAKKEY